MEETFEKLEKPVFDEWKEYQRLFEEIEVFRRKVDERV